MNEKLVWEEDVREVEEALRMVGNATESERGGGNRR